MLRWVFGGVVSIGVGIYLLVRYYSGLPALDQLATVTGVVSSAQVEERRSRRSKSLVLAVRIGDKPAAFYRDRFPEFERIAATIKPGDKVTAWVDVGQNNYIWQLENGGERLVSYDQVAQAQRSNDFWNALFGILFVVVGVGTVGVMAWQWKKASAVTSQTGPEQQPSAE